MPRILILGVRMNLDGYGGLWWMTWCVQGVAVLVDWLSMLVVVEYKLNTLLNTIFNQLSSSSSQLLFCSRQRRSPPLYARGPFS